MLEKEFKEALKKLLELKKMINDEAKSSSGYIEVYNNLYKQLPDINNVILDINSDLFKVIAKTKGFYLKDLSRLDVDFVGMNYDGIMTQIEAVKRHEEISESKLRKVDEKADKLIEMCSVFIESVDRDVNIFSEISKLKEALKNGIFNDNLINCTINYLLENRDKWI